MKSDRRDLLKAMAMASTLPFVHSAAHAAAPARKLRDSQMMGEAKFADVAGIIKDKSKTPSPDEGVLWTNKYVGKP